MIIYYIILSILTLFIITYILANLNIILKNNSLGNFLRGTCINKIFNLIIYSATSMFLIITMIFFIIRLMPMDYFISHTESINSSYVKINYSSNIFEQLLDYYYRILPFPKKICTSTYLENNELKCNCYEYKLIDLGYSYTYLRNVRVWDIIKEKCYVSFLVGIIAYTIQCLIGYPLGVYIARKNNKIIDKSCNFIYLIITSIPAIIYFYIFVIIFMVVFKLPITFDIDDLRSFIAPIVAISISSSFAVAYWVKKYISIEVNKDYVKLAISKGLDDKTIFYKHILRNALIPLIRTIPTSLVLCLSGFYLLESAFNIPGIGLTLIKAINLQDIYLVQGLIIFFSLISIIAYLLGDIITVILNPKVSLREAQKTNEK